MCIYFTLIADSSTVMDNVTNLITHRILNTNLQYSIVFTLNFDEKNLA